MLASTQDALCLYHVVPWSLFCLAIEFLVCNQPAPPQPLAFWILLATKAINALHFLLWKEWGRNEKSLLMIFLLSNYIMCSFATYSLLLLLTFSILNKCRIIFLNLLEQFLCLGNNRTITTSWILPQSWSTFFLSGKKQYYSNYKSIISNTAYHFGASRDFRRSHYFSHPKLYFLVALGIVTGPWIFAAHTIY